MPDIGLDQIEAASDIARHLVRGDWYEAGSLLVDLEDAGRKLGEADLARCFRLYGYLSAPYYKRIAEITGAVRVMQEAGIGRHELDGIPAHTALLLGRFWREGKLTATELRRCFDYRRAYAFGYHEEGNQVFHPETDEELAHLKQLSRLCELKI